MEGILIRHHADLREAAKVVGAYARAAAGGADDDQRTDIGRVRPLTKVQQDRHARRERRLARYHEVVALNDQGYSQREIADALGIGRHVVRLMLRADACPEPLGG